jgi:hypothetical protein
MLVTLYQWDKQQWVIAKFFILWFYRRSATETAMNPHFPSIESEDIVPFNSIMAQGREILADEACPYSPDVKAFLERLFGVDLNIDHTFDIDELDKQIYTTYEAVRVEMANLKTTDPKDRMSVFRMGTQLLEKLTTTRASVRNMKWMGEFQSRVMTAIEEVLDPAERTRFIEILGETVIEEED